MVLPPGVNVSRLAMPAAQAGHHTESVPIVPCGASQGKSHQTRPFKSGCRSYPQIMEDENKQVL